MAKINKLQKSGITIYPATIPQAVIDSETGKTQKEVNDELFKEKAVLVKDNSLEVRSISKKYNTLALALADKNPIDTTTSLPLTVGQFVSIVDDGEKNGIYRIGSISGDGTMSLELQGKLGDLSDYAKEAPVYKALNLTNSIVEDITANFSESQLNALKVVRDIRLVGFDSSEDYAIGIINESENVIVFWAGTPNGAIERIDTYKKQGGGTQWHYYTFPDKKRRIELLIDLDEVNGKGVVLNQKPTQIMAIAKNKFVDVSVAVLSENSENSVFDITGNLTSSEKKVVEAIKDIQLIGFSPNKKYYVNIFTSKMYQHPCRLGIKNTIDDNERYIIDLNHDENVTWTEKGFDSDKVIKALIDWSAILDEGEIINTLNLNNLVINSSKSINASVSPSLNNIINSYDFHHKNYLKDISKVTDVSNVTERKATLGLVDVWFENLSDSIYKDYEFKLFYIGKNDPTYKDIIWLSRREDSDSARESKMISAQSNYFSSNDYYLKKTFNWDGVIIHMIFIPSLLPSPYVDLSSKNIIFKNSEKPNTEIGKLFEDFSKKDVLVNNRIDLLSQSDASVQNPFVKKNIVLSGSSITWGNGMLDGGFVGEVDNFIKNKMSTTVFCDKAEYSDIPTNFNNAKLYKGLGKKLVGLNEKVTFTLNGDEIAICQAKLRTTDYGIMTLKADGVVVGRFDNSNNTLGSESKTFTGNGTDIQFLLERPATYNHIIKVNGVAKSVSINSGGYGGGFPSGVDVLIIRKLNSVGEPIHVAWFENAPANGATISIEYDFGRVVAHEKSTLGQTTSDEINESVFGEGTVSFDPASPSNISSGMEFRSIDDDSVFIYKFLEVKSRTFEIEITGGVNPYFIFNYATNRHHQLMNAGIGGWQLRALLDENNINDYNNFYKDFMPDIIINESGTNDDWRYPSRKIKRTVTNVAEADVKKIPTLEVDSITYVADNNYTVVYKTGLITDISIFSLKSDEIVDSNVEVGDIVRIGNYYGDNKQVVCREIETVDLVEGEITWLQPLNVDLILNIELLDDLIGKEVSIRNLSTYQTHYESLITKLQKVSPQTKIIIAQTGLSNYFTRQLWGYDIVHRRLACKFNNVGVIETNEWLYDFQANNISGNSFIEVQADDSDSYQLSWSGLHQGFKVFVDEKDVYGKDCYIKLGSMYTVDQSLSGSDININSSNVRSFVNTKSLELVFYKNKPSSGTIRIEKADKIWSSDACHVNNTGSYVYGQAYIDRIAKEVNA